MWLLCVADQQPCSCVGILGQCLALLADPNNGDTGQKTFANSYFEFREGKISRIEEYWAESYGAPEWRKKWVEIY